MKIDWAEMIPKEEGKKNVQADGDLTNCPILLGNLGLLGVLYGLLETTERNVCEGNAQFAFL